MSKTYQPTGYEKRKAATDPFAATVLFDFDFANGAFTAGEHRKVRGKEPILARKALQRIKDFGHAELAICCLTYMFVVEGRHKRPERTAYLDCIRTIRVAAHKIAIAADEMAEQNKRYVQKTGYNDTARFEALREMGSALHGEWKRYVVAAFFDRNMKPRPIDNPMASGQIVHGLTAAAALANTAEYILAEHRKQGKQVRAGLGSAMKSGRHADPDRDAFVMDLASIYHRVLWHKPAATQSNAGNLLPFVRFVCAVWKGLREQTIVDVDDFRYQPPSQSKLRILLTQRQD